MKSGNEAVAAAALVVDSLVTHLLMMRPKKKRPNATSAGGALQVRSVKDQQDAMMLIPPAVATGIARKRVNAHGVALALLGVRVLPRGAWRLIQRDEQHAR